MSLANCRSRCFNCGAKGCNVRDCKEPKDHARIAANRRQFGGGGQGPQARYHVDEHQKYGHIKPGLPSKRLRKALGIKDDRRLPEFIYRSAWLFFLAFSSNTIYVCPKEINSFYEIFQPR